jgi:hypothetical protein
MDAKITLRRRMTTFWMFVYWARYRGNDGLLGHCAVSCASEPSEEEPIAGSMDVSRRRLTVFFRQTHAPRCSLDPRNRLFDVDRRRNRAGRESSKFSLEIKSAIF